MSNLRLHVVGLAVLALVLGTGRPAPLAAQSAATFSVTVQSAYLRALPSASATPMYSVFAGATYPITGRTADSVWVSLAFAGATGGTWIRADFGAIEGRLAAVPVTAAGAPAATGGSGASPSATAATSTTSATTTTAAAVTAPSSGAPVIMQLTITVNSTYVRDAPDWQSNRIASLFRNQVVRVGARDGAGEWLQIVGTGWVPAGVGTLSGNLASLPVGGGFNRAPAPGVAAALPPAEQPIWLPNSFTPRMKAVYQQAARRGLNQRMFSVVGDCNSEGYLYLHPLALEHIDLSEYGYLHSTVQRFNASFFRNSLAVDGGFNTASVLDPLWADPTQCRAGESPFACELRVSRSSVVFILLGTGDQFIWEGFEGRYRQMIEYALESGVLPVIVTKADQLESQEGGAPEDYINEVIRRLAREYEVPLFDMNLGTRVLENRGLLEEPGNDFHISAEGIMVHILGTLQALYYITQP